ncbi:cytochrome c oxidase assembly protein subunit 15 [Mycetocola sp. CAN_C7]|uniref:COX15/CtaA family protein n=1 Tax=Mycetocola sp. CAN_C7 TaxID=2787724 RepID=UPI001A1D7F9C
MNNTAEAPRGLRTRIVEAFRRFWAWLPTDVDRRVRVVAWLNLAAQTVLVGTGGAVRLTGSGLGCPTWPKCTDESFISTPEMGIHGVIEFGNRTLFFVLQIIAIFALLFVLRYRAKRRDLFVLTVIPACSVLLQAVVGGITVWSGLNPYVVGFHFVISVALVVFASVLVFRVYSGNGPRLRTAPVWLAATTHAASFFVAVTIVVGILTTGSGPHAGDEGAARNGLDPEILQHVHSWPAYITLALTGLIVAAAWLVPVKRLQLPALGLLAVEGLQIVVGVAQARLGLPPVLVGLHMVLACVLAAAMTVVVLNLTSPAAVPVDAEPVEALQPS